MSSETVDVVVVGAGPAGLRAAKSLKASGFSVRVLEARDRVGGRTWAQSFPDGTYVDFGGQWVGPTQYNIQELVKEYGIKLNPQFDEGKNILELTNNVYYYSGNISSLSMFAKPEIKKSADMGFLNKDNNNNNNAVSTTTPEIDQVWAKLDALCKMVNVEFPMRCPDAKEWEATSFDQWAKQNIKSESTRNLVNWFVRVCLASEPTEVSFLYFLMFLKSGGGYEPLVNIHGGAQQDTVIGGAQQFSQFMHKELDGGKPGSTVYLNCPVTNIRQDAQGVSVFYSKKLSNTAAKPLGPTQDEARGVVRAKRVVVAISPTLCPKIQFSPALPALRNQLSQRMPVGCVIKNTIVYKKPFWREMGFSGELISDSGPIYIAYDKSYKNMHAIVALIAGGPARYWHEKSSAERQAAILKQLARVYKSDEALHPVKFYETDWLNEEWSGGCYMAIMSPGAIAECGKTLRQPHGRIHFAGTETADVWIGYIDGALDSGKRVAEEIKALEKKSKM